MEAPKFQTSGKNVMITGYGTALTYAEARDENAARKICTALNLPHAFAEAAAKSTGNTAAVLQNVGENIADMLFRGEQL